MSGIKHSYRSINGVKARLIERIGNLNPNLRDELRAIKLDWYTIKNVEETGSDGNTPRSPEILIYEEIGGSFGISAETFIEELFAIEADQIDIRINSPGGAVFDAISIYNAIVRHPAHITTYVDALAASAASIIAMAGDECVMMVGSQLMVHDAMGGEMGNSKEMREMATFLDQQSNNIASIYAEKAGGDIKDWRKLMLAETWMMAGEAVDLKLADRVFERPKTDQPEIISDPEEEDNSEEETTEAPDVMADDDENEINNATDVEKLMARKHRMTNRGFKYTGRNVAPDPMSIVESWVSTKDIEPQPSLVNLIANW
jgi:ATP-dependent protease ClpP protease subunit